MSFTRTPKLGLYKPTPGSGEMWNNPEENSDKDKIDAQIGTFVCTAGSRPASPFAGQVIYETDTDRTYIRRGTAWVPQNPSVYKNQDGGFPLPGPTVAAAEFVTHRVTIPAADYGRLVSARASDRYTFTQNADYEMRLYIGASLIAQRSLQGVTTASQIQEIFGSAVVNAGSDATARAVEIRMARVNGTGTMTGLSTPVASKPLEVTVSAAGTLAAS